MLTLSRFSLIFVLLKHTIRVKGENDKFVRWNLVYSFNRDVTLNWAAHSTSLRPLNGMANSDRLYKDYHIT